MSLHCSRLIDAFNNKTTNLDLCNDEKYDQVRIIKEQMTDDHRK